MVEAFGGWTQSPSWSLWQKKRTLWHQTFLKSKSGEENEQTSPWLWAVWDALIQGQVCRFCFPFHFIWWVVSTRLNLNTWMALFGKISLNSQKSEENVRNVSYINFVCTRQSFRTLRSCFFIFQEFNSWSRESNNQGNWNLGTWLKLKKTLNLIFKGFETEGFHLQDFT